MEIRIGSKLKTIIPTRLGSIKGIAFLKALFSFLLLIFFPYKTPGKLPHGLHAAVYLSFQILLLL